MTEWTTELTLPGGHRIMRDTPLKLPAIVDESGATPESTDGGVDRLHLTRPIDIGTGGCFVQVYSEGCSCDRVVPITPNDVLVLATGYAMRVRSNGQTFKLEQVDDWTERHKELLDSLRTGGPSELYNLWVDFMTNKYSGTTDSFTRKELSLSLEAFESGCDGALKITKAASDLIETMHAGRGRR